MADKSATLGVYKYCKEFIELQTQPLQLQEFCRLAIRGCLQNAIDLSMTKNSDVNVPPCSLISRKNDLAYRRFARVEKSSRPTTEFLIDILHQNGKVCGVKYVRNGYEYTRCLYVDDDNENLIAFMYSPPSPGVNNIEVDYLRSDYNDQIGYHNVRRRPTDNDVGLVTFICRSMQTTLGSQKGYLKSRFLLDAKIGVIFVVEDENINDGLILEVKKPYAANYHHNNNNNSDDKATWIDKDRRNDIILKSSSSSSSSSSSKMDANVSSRGVSPRNSIINVKSPTITSTELYHKLNLDAWNIGIAHNTSGVIYSNVIVIEMKNHDFEYTRLRDVEISADTILYPSITRRKLMQERIQLMPLPPILKKYLNYHREFDTLAEMDVTKMYSNKLVMTKAFNCFHFTSR